MRRSVFLLAALAVSLMGCMVGPNYNRPAVATPPQFRGAPAGFGLGWRESPQDVGWLLTRLAPLPVVPAC